MNKLSMGGGRRRSSQGSMVSYSQVQIIDFDGNFVPDFDQHLQKFGLADCGFSYNVVTVLGCQSSGKSTLLNSLFGTTFPEMNAMQGRSQTTKGIWAARDRVTPTLIVDVEGTDSKERGEDRLTFEHRASLFSLAVADAVLINMWYQDLGRYSASNYGLLKTVLAVNLELFNHEGDTKTTMIFVIRDWSPAVTPLAVLEGMLMRDLDEIWNEIKKPADLRKSKLTDFFKFVVFGMPSKITDNANYEVKVRELRSRWLDEEAPKEYSRKVPADGFAIYARQVWATILSSSELNIPSQKEMVATYRCEEIRRNVLQEFVPQLQAHSSDPTKLFDDKIAEKVITGALEMYHKDAWRYQENIYIAKKDLLLESLFNEVQKPLEKFLFGTRQQLLKAGSAALERECKKDDWDNTKMHDGTSCIDFWSSLLSITQQWKAGVLADFDGICGHATIDCIVEINSQPEPYREHIQHVFDMDMIKKTLEESLDETIRKVLSNENQAFQKYLEERVDAFRPEIEGLYNAAELKHSTFWESVSQICAERADAFEVELGPTLEGVTDPSCPSQVSLHDRLAIMMIKSLREILIKRADMLSDLIHRRFCVFFEADDKGVPYYWAGLSQDKIRNIYVEAKDKAEVLLPILSTFDVKLNMILTDASAVEEAEMRLLRAPMFTEAKRLDIANLAAKRMLKSCQEAQFIQATGGKVASPAWWWWGLLLILGWNELMAILRSPVFFTLVLAAAIILGAAFYTGNMMMLINTGRSMTSLGLSMIIPMLTKLQGQHQVPASPQSGSPADTAECRNNNTPTTTANE